MAAPPARGMQTRAQRAATAAALQLQGPRSSILAHFHNQHYQASGIPLADVELALIAGERLRNPGVQNLEPYLNFPVNVNTAIDTAIRPADRSVSKIAKSISTAVFVLFDESRSTTGNLDEHLEGVVRVFARVGLLLVGNAINKENLLTPLPAAGFNGTGVINPGTNSVGYDVEFNYRTREPANIGGRADAVLLRRTEVAGDPTLVHLPAVNAGNFYVPLCFLEVKHAGAGLLDAGLAECLIAAAVNGNRHGLASVAGIVTNLREWRFLRVEAGAVRVSAIQNLHIYARQTISKP